ncbi:conserved domain protein [Yasminevirus sp. GU-2018]|uniref:Conserved domain protein n=1 Tax=Yasminevirus sp. GU-2018 TaxID=2420051 RepID=A0A5K0UAW8_9VIRU|nr:conserved domain protein [Yasminevirus sp. GU-2018]
MEELPKSQKITQMTKEDLIELMKDVSCMTDALRKMGIQNKTFYLALLRKKINDEGLEVPLYKHEFRKKQELNDVMVENSSFHRDQLKKRLLKEALIENMCAICDLGPEWNGKPLVLQLDHINGINNDHRIENLRMLCPNCHSQTETFTGKQRRKMRKCAECDTNIYGQYDKCDNCYAVSGKRENIISKTNTCKCGKKIVKDAEHCVECMGKNSRRFEATKEQLEQLLLVEKKTYVEVGKQFGVSDNAIKRRCRILGVILPARKVRVAKLHDSVKSHRSHKSPKDTSDGENE